MTLAMLVSTLLNCVFQQIFTLYNTQNPHHVVGFLLFCHLEATFFCVSKSNVLADNFVGFENAFFVQKVGAFLRV